jgi:hypothetical protein
MSGACAVAEDCAPLPEGLDGVAKTTCRAKRCRVERSNESPEWLAPEGSKAIAVSSPDAPIPKGDLPQFEWRQTNSAVLLRVLDRVPDSDEAFEQATKWGLTKQKGASPRASWSDGFIHDKSGWVNATPDAPDPGVYQFVVLAVSSDGVLRASPFVAFTVGDRLFKEPGDDCAADGKPDACANPGQALSCYQEHCRRLCGSSSDCDADTERCSAPLSVVDSRRFCVVR